MTGPGAHDGVPTDPWTLVYEGFDPAREGLREALCTLGNGRFATRGAAAEADADGVHYPGTYAAGVFNRLRTEVAGRTVENEDMVNLPNWLPLRISVEGGPPLSPKTAEVLAWDQRLDLRQGVLTRRMRLRDEAGRTSTITERRIVSMDEPWLCALQATILAEDWSGGVEVRSGIDGSVTNSGVERYRKLPGRHLAEASTQEADAETIVLTTQTTQSHVRIGVAARTRVLRGGEPVAHARETIKGEDRIAHALRFEMSEGASANVEKVAALVTSRDVAISEPGLEAGRVASGAASFESLLDRHALRWHHLWEQAGIEIEDGHGSRLVLTLHVFHLLQTVSQHTVDLDAGIPARGLTGEAYRGHIFWDELFILPFLNLRMPELARGALRYRHHRLPEARRAAARAGHRGAMYPWQSGSDGREESQVVHLNPHSGRWVPDNSHRQRHINHAVAFNFWHHYQATGDIEFLATTGAEVILEVARFWSSAAAYDHARDRYVIRGVMGPDEFHDGYPDDPEPAGVDNNAYTNVMAVWVLCRALELLERRLPRERAAELSERLVLTRSELDRWEQLTRRMFVPFHDGVISQFEGYERLEELDWEDYRVRHGDIHRLDRILEAEGDTVNRYRASKQADVLMLLYLLSTEELEELFGRLGYPFDAELVRRTVDYYSKRTAHGSTLSNVVSSWVLARSDRERSWRLFAEALKSDIADVQGGTTQEGIHLGAMAGTLDILQVGYTGLDPREDVLWLNPRLPSEVRRMEMPIRYRHHWGLRIAIDHERLRVTAPPGDAPPIRVGYLDQVHELSAGESLELSLDQG